MKLSCLGVLAILGRHVVSGQMQSASDPFNNGTIEDRSEDSTEGISYTEVEEIFLGAQVDQLLNENEKLKQSLEVQVKIAENLRKINAKLTAEKNENMEKNQRLKAENIQQASQIVDLQRNLQSTQAELYTLKPKLTLLQNNLSITLQLLENATAHARDVESLLQTELYLKSTYEEEASLERQSHEITKQSLEDLQTFSTFVINVTKIQNLRILQLENITSIMDNALKIVKEKETLYMAENSAYRNEILVQQNATSKERDQKEKLKTSLMRQSQLGKTKERMLRILRNALVDMTISVPNCTSLATQAHKSHVDALLENEDPMKHLIAQFEQFNSSSIDIQNLYVQLNSELKEQIDTKNKIMDENNLLINSLENEIDDRKEIIKSQSGSLQLLTEEVNRFMPNDLKRARVRRNLDGTIKSANLCQCIPEAPKDSLLKLREIHWTCPNDMAIFQNGSQLDLVASFPCSNSGCSVEAASWPQCEGIDQKPWSPWTYTSCSTIEIGNKTFLCGTGQRYRSRAVRDSWSSWREEGVSEPCDLCSLTYGAKSIMTILPSTLETALTNSISMVKVTDGGWTVFGPCTKTCGGGIQERTCTNPAPGPGGMPCTGNSTSSCNNQLCPISTWEITKSGDCWSNCGRKGGPCPSFCGCNGYCCREGYDGCPPGAGEASPNLHTCVAERGYWDNEFKCVLKLNFTERIEDTGRTSGNICREYESLGCWKDTGNRAIATLEGTDIRLTGKYDERENAVKICYEVAKSKGYPAFAVQHGGQCFGSSTALQTYKKYGAAANCADGKGGDWANDVYKIQA